MFKLRNKAGNVYKVVDTEYKRDMLLAQGYEPVEEDQVAKPLEEMTVAELKAYAEAHDIDLTGADRKQEILDRIKEAEAKE